MCRCKFAELFKRVAGMGHATFVRRWRLSRASQLLRTTDTPIKSVARQFGFRHTTHFHSAFTAQFGTTPARYRHHAS